MPSTNCSVLGCKSKERKHVFPQNDDDFNMWLQRCNNDKLFHLEKSVVRRRYAVCHLHFDRSCDSPGTKKLKKGSLPTLFLPSNNAKSNYIITCLYIYICMFMFLYSMYCAAKMLI